APRTVQGATATAVSPCGPVPARDPPPVRSGAAPARRCSPGRCGASPWDRSPSRCRRRSPAPPGPRPRRRRSPRPPPPWHGRDVDRKSTRLNSSHVSISYAVFCLKKKNKHIRLSYHEVLILGGDEIMVVI